jgi:diguanylate cyclase (GGDEF)-like protein
VSWGSRIHGASSHQAEGAALVLFDFDDFKRINDLHGHPPGDAELRAVGQAVQQVRRRSDRLARIGGDEFAVIAAGAGAGSAPTAPASLVRRRGAEHGNVWPSLPNLRHTLMQA